MHDPANNRLVLSTYGFGTSARRPTTRKARRTWWPVAAPALAAVGAATVTAVFVDGRLGGDRAADAPRAPGTERNPQESLVTPGFAIASRRGDAGARFQAERLNPERPDQDRPGAVAVPRAIASSSLTTNELAGPVIGPAAARASDQGVPRVPATAALLATRTRETGSSADEATTGLPPATLRATPPAASCLQAGSECEGDAAAPLDQAGNAGDSSSPANARAMPAKTNGTLGAASPNASTHRSAEQPETLAMADLPDAAAPGVPPGSSDHPLEPAHAADAAGGAGIDSPRDEQKPPAGGEPRFAGEGGLPPPLRPTPSVSAGPAAGDAASGVETEFQVSAGTPGSERGQVAAMVREGELVSVRLGDLISLFEHQLERPLFVWMSSSTSAGKYVDLEALAAAGLQIEYDAAERRLVLKAVDP